MKVLKVLIIGGGTTGSLIACLLKRSFKERISIEVWDKSRGIGGRMSTARVGGGKSTLTADLGAQYISATTDYQVKHKSIYEELLANETLVPLQGTIEGDRHSADGTLHYVTPKGSSSIPKYFLNQSDCSFHSSTLLHSVDVKGDMLCAGASDTSNGESKEVSTNADVIILTLPVPQILKLKGDIENLLQKYRTELEDVKYSSRYALALFFENTSQLPCIDWSAKYVTDNPCIRYISVDTQKRNQDVKNGISLVVHCSIPFTMKYLENSFSDVQPIVENHLRKILPDLPKETSSKFLRWRYSQVTHPYVNEPGHLILNTSPLLLVAGDGFTQSKFDGCVDSAESVLKYVREKFPGGKY